MSLSRGLLLALWHSLWLILSLWLKASLRIQETSLLAHKMKCNGGGCCCKVRLWWWEYFPSRTTSHFAFYILIPGLEVAEGCHALTFALFWECAQDSASHYMIHLTFLC